MAAGTMKPLLIVLILFWVLPVGAWDWSGNTTVEGRLFFQSPLDPRQYDNDGSVSLEPELAHEWNDGRDIFVMRLFGRLDARDDQRSHADVRELQWTHAGDGWETLMGVGKVYWGVTEAWHLVDIVNQTDLVENPDGEQKLGQPMVKLSLERGWGTLDLFALVGFRERTFPGVEGRFRTHPRVDTDLAFYQSGGKWKRVDVAARWSHYIGDWDLGISVFHGTGRDPLFVPMPDGRGALVLAPYYELIDQASLDLQATLGQWLWKLEALYRESDSDGYYAWTGGFEYTLVGIADSASDLGILLEALYDQRGEESATPFNHDAFLALRWTANDEQSSELLAGAIVDWRNGSTLLNVEGSRRLGQDWKLSLQLRAWLNVDKKDLQYPFNRDDYLQLELACYF
jgi:hypothetical protein